MNLPRVSRLPSEKAYPCVIDRRLAEARNCPPGEHQARYAVAFVDADGAIHRWHLCGNTAAAVAAKVGAVYPPGPQPKEKS